MTTAETIVLELQRTAALERAVIAWLERSLVALTEGADPEDIAASARELLASRGWEVSA